MIVNAIDYSHTCKLVISRLKRKVRLPKWYVKMKTGCSIITPYASWGEKKKKKKLRLNSLILQRHLILIFSEKYFYSTFHCKLPNCIRITPSTQTPLVLILYPNTYRNYPVQLIINIIKQHQSKLVVSLIVWSI